VVDYLELARLSNVWRGMLVRCYDPTSKPYKDYGGRKITMAPEWLDYNTFYIWAINNGAEPGLQLERLDNNGNYGPDNCTFVTRSVNMRNTRRARLITAFGETKCLLEWVEDSRCVVTISGTLWRRIQAGWAPEEALTLTHASLRQIGTFQCGHTMAEYNVYRRKTGKKAGTRICKICAKAEAKDVYKQTKVRKARGIY
jgi:hypothetical protein